MAVTLITILVLNAVTDTSHERPVYWVTLPAAFVLFCWDLAFGWFNKKKTREIARKGREAERARAERMLPTEGGSEPATTEIVTIVDSEGHELATIPTPQHADEENAQESASMEARRREGSSPRDTVSSEEIEIKEPAYVEKAVKAPHQVSRTTLVSVVADAYLWAQETFPTATAVLTHLPYALVPFALCMFVLVQGLASKGWIAVFAYGWVSSPKFIIF